MQTILRILKATGGWHHGLSLRIDNPPFMPLCIEAVDESGPCGLPAHYGEQNGDAMRDPEMLFELGLSGGVHLNPFDWRNRYAGVEQWSRFIQDGHYAFHRKLHKSIKRSPTCGTTTCGSKASPKPSSSGAICR